MYSPVDGHLSGYLRTMVLLLLYTTLQIIYMPKFSWVDSMFSKHRTLERESDQYYLLLSNFKMDEPVSIWAGESLYGINVTDFGINVTDFTMLHDPLRLNSFSDITDWRTLLENVPNINKPFSDCLTPFDVEDLDTHTCKT